MADWIGYQWLAKHYGVSPVQAFRTDSAIAKSRTTVREDGYVHEYYPSAARPADTLVGHLTFALKHEGILGRRWISWRKDIKLTAVKVLKKH